MVSACSKDNTGAVLTKITLVTSGNKERGATLVACNCHFTHMSIQVVESVGRQQASYHSS